MLIVIEGIDGSGKGTQAAMLLERLRVEGKTVSLFQFPQYNDTFFGREVGRYLNGDFGTIDSVPVKFSSLLYSLDRFQASKKIAAELENSHDVICDRYTGSNIAHQAARVPETERAEFIAWLQEVEEEILSIPAPDLVIFLDTEVEQSQHLVGKKDKRIYTDKTHDIHEASENHLQLALENFRALSNQFGWKKIQCLGNDAKLKNKESIHEEIYLEVVNARISKK